MKKFISVLTLAFCLTSAFFVSLAEEEVKSEAKSENTAEIVDYASKTYDEKLEKLKIYGIINCYEDGNFYPEKEVTRAEFCKMLALIAGCDDKTDDVNPMSYFSDVTLYHWANRYVNFCYENGFVNGKIAPEPVYGETKLSDGAYCEKEIVGYSNLGVTKFDPDSTVTYFEMYKMVLNATGYETKAQALGGYPQGYVEVAENMPLVTNKIPDYKTAVTRADAVEIIYNALHLPLMLKKADFENEEWYEANGADGAEYATLFTKNFSSAVPLFNGSEFEGVWVVISQLKKTADGYSFNNSNSKDGTTYVIDKDTFIWETVNTAPIEEIKDGMDIMCWKRTADSGEVRLLKVELFKNAPQKYDSEKN